MVRRNRLITTAILVAVATSVTRQAFPTYAQVNLELKAPSTSYDKKINPWIGEKTPELVQAETKLEVDDVKFTNKEYTGTTYTDLNGNSVNGASVFGINREEVTTSTIGYHNVEEARLGALNYEKERSNYYQLLSGEGNGWNLTVVQNAEQAQKFLDDGFMNPNYTVNAEDGWKDVQLPASWTSQGFDFPIYTNTEMPWQNEYDTNIAVPQAPVNYNPVGLYRKTFTVNDAMYEQDGRIYIAFEGVESAYYVYVNGKEVGYSEDTFRPHKFDITDYLNAPGEENTLAVKVLKVNDGEGQVLLTYKRLAAEKGNEKLKEAFENKEVLKATVAQILGGGLSVVVEEARVFIPASLVSDVYEKDLSKYQGQEIEFVISEFNPRRNRIIGDRRQLLVAEKAEMQKELFAKLAVGDTVVGTVKNVTDFGAFIDLGGVDGLLHISEMSWGRVENPKKVFKVGEEVKVLVKDINETKVALSLKFPNSNPWANAAENFAVGKEVTGKVARMTDFGAFVELAPGVDALLHVSQISRAHVEKPADALTVGQVITAKVVDLNEADKKISLSMKALEPEVAPVAEEAPEETAE